MTTMNEQSLQDGLRTRTSKLPKVVLSRDLGELTRTLEQIFRSEGWCVKVAEDADNVRQLAVKAKAVILPAVSAQESGFLTTAKLMTANPRIKIVLVGPESESMGRFARFVGAMGYVNQQAPASHVARLLLSEEAL
jgi:DNA-binding response OmpR family regulator